MTAPSQNPPLHAAATAVTEVNMDNMAQSTSQGIKQEIIPAAPVSGSSSSSSSSTCSSAQLPSPPPPASRKVIEVKNAGEPTVVSTIGETVVINDTKKAASLSSYIQRSLSGLFSDVAMCTQAEEETEQIVEPELIHQQQHYLDPAAIVIDTAGVGTTAETPVRKRSRLDLEGDSHEQHSEDGMISHEVLYPANDSHSQQSRDPSSSRKALRRQSFSYQCLNKLFDIDKDDQNTSYDHDQDPLLPYTPALENRNQEQRQSSSPRTVADNNSSSNKITIGTSAHHHLLEDDAPFQLPQPPLEESESMNSFIDVLGAVDLDTMDTAGCDNRCHDSTTCQQAGGDTADNVTSFGWYISEAGQQKEVSTSASSGIALTVTMPLAEETAQETAGLEEYTRAADTIDNVLGDFFG